MPPLSPHCGEDLGRVTLISKPPHLLLQKTTTPPVMLLCYSGRVPVYTEIVKYYTMNLAISLGHWRESGLNPIASCLNNMNSRTIQFSTTNFAPVIFVYILYFHSEHIKVGHCSRCARKQAGNCL